MGALVNYMTEKGVAVVTLNDPPANAYSYETLKELDSAILEARFDNDVHVVVLTGHGDRFFSAGANLDVLREADATFKYYFGLYAQETLARLEQTPKLCIAALNGHALGGGLEIALACDLRIARAGDGQLGLGDVGMGLMPAAGGAQRLARLIGKSRAIEMLVEGEKLGVDRAAELGLVNKVWEAASAEEFRRNVIAYGQSFCPPQGAAFAVGRIKRAVQTGSEMGQAEGVSFEHELQAALVSSADGKEGLAAHADKRKPTFRGR